MTDKQAQPLRKIYCNFCGKHDGEVLALFAGPRVFICNECSILTLDIMLEKLNSEPVKAYVKQELAARTPQLPQPGSDAAKELVECMAEAIYPGGWRACSNSMYAERNRNKLCQEVEPAYIVLFEKLGGV